MENKEKFEKAEVEEIRFENDVIATSPQTITVGGQDIQGGIPNPPPIPFNP